MLPDIVDCAKGTWKSAYSEQEYEALHRPDNPSLHSETYFIPHGYRKKKRDYLCVRETNLQLLNRMQASKKEAKLTGQYLPGRQ
jgi:nicotinamidase-related amidase